MEELSQRMAELEAHNKELDARERLMTQVVQAQEKHIDILSANQVIFSPHRRLQAAVTLRSMHDMQVSSITPQSTSSPILVATGESFY